MAESILVTGKKISSMELVTNVTGNEKIPTGQPDDLALTPNQIADHTISRGDLASQEDLSQVEVSLGTQITDLTNDVNSSDNSIRGLIAAEEAARIAKDLELEQGLVDEATLRIAADDSLQTSLDEEVEARIAADDLKVDKEGSVSSVADRVGDVVLAPSDVLVGGFGSQEDVNKYIPKPFLSGYTYGLGERVVLENGDIVKSIVADNTVDPNVDMTGWVNYELDQKIRNGQIINLVSDFGAVGGTDCTTNIYNAILEALRTGKALYIPSTTEPYLYRTNQLTFYLNEVPLSEQKTLFIYGDGEASVLKCMDGQINARYSLSLRFEPRASFKTFYFKDFRIDNNARGSTPPPPEDAFAYEQSPTISFAGGSAGVTIDSIIYENIVIEDPAADGWHHPLLGAITNITYINPIERGRTRVRSSIQEYYRARNVTIINPQVHSIETEATATPPARSNINIIGGTTKNLDFLTAGYNHDVFIEITDHINTERFNCGSMRSIKINGGEIRMNPDWPRIYSCRNFKATNTIVKIPYNPITGACKSLLFYKGVGLKQTIEFNQTKFMLDYVGELPVAATGHLISGENATAITVAEMANQEIFIRGCEFDERAFGSINAYRMGTIVLENNKYGGINDAIRWHNTAGTATDLTVIGGDFSKVQGSALALGGSGASHKLTLLGEWVGAKAASHKMVFGALSTSAPYIFNHRKIIAESLPTSALAKDIVCLGSIAATVGSVIEYQCTVSSATAPTFACSKQLGLYAAATASLPVLTASEKWARAHDTTTNTVKTWTGTAWV